MSACEACFRIFAFELHSNFSYVMRLAPHLENQQSVVFGDNSIIHDILIIEKHSPLAGWFVANRSFPSARNLTYLKFPEFFFQDESKREWVSHDFLYLARKYVPGIDADKHTLNAALVHTDKGLQRVSSRFS